METVAGVYSHETGIVGVQIPRFEQKERMWCGPAALQSMLYFYKCSITQEEISKFIDVKKGCFIQELGLFALTKNFNVTIFSYDMLMIDPSWSQLTGVEVANKIRSRLDTLKSSKSAKNSYATLAEFLLSGGHLSIKLPRRDEIISMLQNGTPILAIVNSNSFYNRARLDSNGNANDVLGYAGGHFILVVGYKNGYFYVIDPSYDNPVSFVHEDRFMFSLSIWGGWMMIIDEKK